MELIFILINIILIIKTKTFLYLIIWLILLFIREIFKQLAIEANKYYKIRQRDIYVFIAWITDIIFYWISFYTIYLVLRIYL